MIIVQQFPVNQTPQQSSNRGWHGWPNGGGQPQSDAAWENGKFWHGQPYNQYIQVKTYPDGTQETYCPYVSVYQFSHRFGHHYVMSQDGIIDHSNDQRATFTGGNHVEAVSGHYDGTNSGHHRENIVGDAYQHIKGVAHVASLGGHVHFNPGNSVMAHGGSHMMVALSDDASLGIGHGGNGQNSPNRMLMTKNLMTVASVSANVAMGSSQGNVGHEATQGNMKLNAMKGNMNINGQQTFVNGQTTQINGTSKVQIGSGGQMACPNIIFPGGGCTWQSASGTTGDQSPVQAIAGDQQSA